MTLSHAVELRQVFDRLRVYLKSPSVIKIEITHFDGREQFTLNAGSTDDEIERAVSGYWDGPTRWMVWENISVSGPPSVICGEIVR